MLNEPPDANSTQRNRKATDIGIIEVNQILSCPFDKSAAPRGQVRASNPSPMLRSWAVGTADSHLSPNMIGTTLGNNIA